MRKKLQIVLVFMLLLLFAGTLTVSANEWSLKAKKVTINVGDTYDLDVTGTTKEPKWTS